MLAILHAVILTLVLMMLSVLKFAARALSR
jgi:hypothetical protein